MITNILSKGSTDDHSESSNILSKGITHTTIHMATHISIADTSEELLHEVGQIRSQTSTKVLTERL